MQLQHQRIGILGGGQLGRMLVQAAIPLDLDIRILDNDAAAPCASLTPHFNVGDLLDYDAVYQFGQQCDVLTIEIEKVNTQALYQLQREGKRIYPQPHVIELIQDKRLQKQFLIQHSFPTADFVLTDTLDQLHQYAHWLPAVHKIGRGGYDGKGVQIIHNQEDIRKGFDAPSVLERLVPIHKEIAVLVARNERGEIRTFPAVESVFHPEANLVEYLFAPAALPEDLRQQAEQLAESLIEQLDMIGLLAVELFWTQDNQLLINELAPRPHNSGHTTTEGNPTSQFEQLWRAILNLPLGDTATIIPCAMVNLLGEEGHSGAVLYQGLRDVLEIDGAHIHLYGKKQTKPFRKMGHVTIADHDTDRLRQKAELVKNTLRVISK